MAARCVTGLSDTLPYGHPVRGIALAELGKLLCVDVDPNYESPASASPYTQVSSFENVNGDLPRGLDRLQVAAQVLYRAKEELLIGFGRTSGGGEVGSAVVMHRHD